MNYIPYIQRPYFEFSDLDHFLDLTCPATPDLVRIVSTKGKKTATAYIDMIATLDIETTSAYINGDKQAFMYVWQFSLSGAVIIGRTWTQYRELLAALHMRLGTAPQQRGQSPGRVLPIYVHNLAFEFQFLRLIHAWADIFALDSHKPIRAQDLDGFEFRCSYVLSGLPLQLLEPKNGIRKAKGDLDYRKIRHFLTPLTKREIGYCVDDVRVLASWLDDKLNDNGDNLATVPMTRTGYVRRDTRARCMQDPQYKALIKSLTLEPYQYKRLKQLFQGGFTHANAHYSRLTLENVHSKDITSSYPTVMVGEKFPLSKFKPYQPKDQSDFENTLSRFCCMFEARFYNIRPIQEQENPISASKCIELINEVENNGRIVTADYLAIELNEVDFSYIRRFYTWDKITIANMERAAKGYLPKPFVESILHYYAQKTELKKKKGSEVMYAKYKEFVNAIYGMTVTDLIKDVWTLDGFGTWTSETPDATESIDRINKSKNRFLYYAWGVWTTSYARRNLFLAIEELGDDYIYADTDSVKYLNWKRHEAFFDAYNQDIIAKLKAACAFHGINPDAVEPKNIKKIKCPLGVWDDEGTYRRFKTLGAKRYLVEAWDDDLNEWGLKSTVAGLSKKMLPLYLQQAKFFTIDGDEITKQYGLDPFEKFEDHLHVPFNHTGKLTHTYIDEPAQFKIKDYKGIEVVVETFGGVHLENQSYDLGLSEVYLNYLTSLTDGEDEQTIFF